MKKCNKSIVIDACVAKSASERVHPISSNCRVFFETIRDTGCVVVFNRELLDEWSKHQSLYTARWRASMIARRKVLIIKNSVLEDLRNSLVQGVKTEKTKDAVMKDIHLVEASLFCDKIIFSKDNAMRKILGELSLSLKVLRDIVWLDPSNDKEGVVEWLKEGGKINKEFTLGLLGRGAYSEVATDK